VFIPLLSEISCSLASSFFALLSCFPLFPSLTSCYCHAITCFNFLFPHLEPWLPPQLIACHSSPSETSFLLLPFIALLSYFVTFSPCLFLSYVVCSGCSLNCSVLVPSPSAFLFRIFLCRLLIQHYKLFATCFPEPCCCSD
jgi:hypothetical protein